MDGYRGSNSGCAGSNPAGGADDHVVQLEGQRPTKPLHESSSLSVVATRG